MELDNLEARLMERYGRTNINNKDVLSAALYPKVFEEYQVRVGVRVWGRRPCCSVWNALYMAVLSLTASSLCCATASSRVLLLLPAPHPPPPPPYTTVHLPP